MLKLKNTYRIDAKYALNIYVFKGEKSFKQNNLINLSRIESSSAMKEQLEFYYKKNKKSLLRL